MECKATVMESQVDWLTVSKRPGKDEGKFAWWAKRVLAAEGRKGGKPAPFSLHGYEGERVGRMRYGWSERGQLVQLSGDLASQELQTAAFLSDNCSRVDLAVTVRLDPRNGDLEYTHYMESLRARRAEGRHPSSSLTMSDDGGATFYLGKRTSTTMLRVYNKEVESEDPRYIGCHRYELEVKGDRAPGTLARLVAAPDRPRYVQGVVQWWCDEHDINPIFCHATPVALVPGLRRRSDAETKLLWLEAAVRPTVDWLRQFGDQGRVLRALGYTEDDWAPVVNYEEATEGGED